MQERWDGSQLNRCPFYTRAAVLVVVMGAVIGSAGLLLVEALCHCALPLMRVTDGRVELTGPGTVAIVAGLLSLQALFGIGMLRGRMWAHHLFLACIGWNLLAGGLLWFSGYVMGDGIVMFSAIALWLSLIGLKDYREFVRSRTAQRT